jgi:hypothetical protein
VGLRPSQGATGGEGPKVLAESWEEVLVWTALSGLDLVLIPDGHSQSDAKEMLFFRFHVRVQ